MTNDIEAAERDAFAKWVNAHFGEGAMLWQEDPVFVPRDPGADSIDVGPEWDAWQARAALAHAARGEVEEAEVHRQLDEATRIVKPYYNATGAFVGGPGNWIAPVHACPKCGKSLNWREFGGGIVADCACGRQTSYLFHPTPPPATGDASNPGEKEER